MKIFSFSFAILLLITVITGCNADAKTEVEGAFEYRDIYLPDYRKAANEHLYLNTLEEDWGIWGHNLSLVLPEKPSHQVYAEVRGARDDDQFCFTSDKLFGYISDYIDNNYSAEDSVRFAILPKDNSIVCLCSECVKIGNTKGNASPAVTKMIERLAKKYPSHMFFTSHYSTTSTPPTRKLPENAGVIISAMDYPLSTAETPQEAKFMDVIAQWNDKANKIYIWDYVNNFDDYLTPFPVFSVMQRRLQKYRDAGVDGVFMNGSGPDYSTFGRLKKAVLAELLINPDADWKSLLISKAKQFYPTAGTDISNFMIAQENMVTENGKKLPLYEGVTVARKTYLPEEEFVSFYNTLVEREANARGLEKENLEKILGGLSYTMLELNRINGTPGNPGELIERLEVLPARDVNVYSESSWYIPKYIKSYNTMVAHAEEVGNTNLLKGVKLKPRTPLDEDYSDISIVTDGLLGIPGNYHNGNLITSASPSFSIEIPRQPGMKKIRVWLVYNPGVKIDLPEYAFVKVNGAQRAPKEPKKPEGKVGHSYLEFDVGDHGEIVLTLVKDPEVKTMAIDEIEGFAN